MKQFIVLLFASTIFNALYSQNEAQDAKFYIGLSYGTSYSIGNFKDTDVSNPDAGFAKNGKKIDFYGGRFLNEKVTLTGTFRYQTYETEIEDLIETFNTENPGSQFYRNHRRLESLLFFGGHFL